jgi:hypothetical protein
MQETVISYSYQNGVPGFLVATDVNVPAQTGPSLQKFQISTPARTRVIFRAT